MLTELHEQATKMLVTILLLTITFVKQTFFRVRIKIRLKLNILMLWPFLKPTIII